jgi:hypothetical protein
MTRFILAVLAVMFLSGTGWAESTSPPASGTATSPSAADCDQWRRTLSKGEKLSEDEQIRFTQCIGGGGGGVSCGNRWGLKGYVTIFPEDCL